MYLALYFDQVWYPNCSGCFGQGSLTDFRGHFELERLCRECLKIVRVVKGISYPS